MTMDLRAGMRGLLLTATPVLLVACATRALQFPVDDRAFEVSAAWIAGRPAVAWYGGRLAHEALFLRHADARGQWGPALQLTDATRDAYEPSLQDIDGEALVAWYEQDPRAGEVRRQHALLARFDSSGHLRWRRELSDADASGRNPVVRVAAGIIEVAWIEQRGGDNAVLRAASLDSGGNWLRPPRDVAVAARETWNLNAAIAQDGALHVVFDAGQPGSAKELHWVRVGTERITTQRVSRDDLRDSVYPDLALDADRFAMAWFDSRDGNEEVYVRCGRLGQGGAAIPEQPLDDGMARRVTQSPGSSHGAYLAWHGGQVELAWTEVNGARRTLWRQRFDRECRPLDRARRVDSLGRDAGIVSLAASGPGFMLAWNGQRGDSSTPPDPCSVCSSSRTSTA